MSTWSMTYRQSVFKWHQSRLTNIYKSFTHKMAAKTSWHRYGTKLRHCHPMYSTVSSALQNHRISLVGVMLITFGVFFDGSITETVNAVQIIWATYWRRWLSFHLFTTNCFRLVKIESTRWAKKRGRRLMTVLRSKLNRLIFFQWKIPWQICS